MSEFICHEDAGGNMHLNIPCKGIVRCRDCEHIHEHDLSAYYGDHEHDHYSCCRLLEPGAISVEPDGFCSWGVRKEDER